MKETELPEQNVVEEVAIVSEGVTIGLTDTVILLEFTSLMEAQAVLLVKTQEIISPFTKLEEV